MDFVVFGKSECPWCDKAKDLLTRKGLTFDYRDVSDGSAFNEMTDWVFEAEDFFPRTVPQVFKMTEDGRKWIGGYEDLAAHLVEDELEEVHVEFFDL